MVYPKFKQKEECAFQKRTICNYCDCGILGRCPYIKCISMGNWHCIYKKQSNNDIISKDNKESTKEVIKQ